MQKEQNYYVGFSYIRHAISREFIAVLNYDVAMLDTKFVVFNYQR